MLSPGFAYFRGLLEGRTKARFSGARNISPVNRLSLWPLIMRENWKMTSVSQICVSNATPRAELKGLKYTGRTAKHQAKGKDDMQAGADVAPPSPMAIAPSGSRP
jgi:hypothetical protein